MGLLKSQRTGFVNTATSPPREAHDGHAVEGMWRQSQADLLWQTPSDKDALCPRWKLMLRGSTQGPVSRKGVGPERRACGEDM